MALLFVGVVHQGRCWAGHRRDEKRRSAPSLAGARPKLLLTSRDEALAQKLNARSTRGSSISVLGIVGVVFSITWRSPPTRSAHQRGVGPTEMRELWHGFRSKAVYNPRSLAERSKAIVGERCATATRAHDS
jgi:hypothetical protein